MNQKNIKIVTLSLIGIVIISVTIYFATNKNISMTAAPTPAVNLINKNENSNNQSNQNTNITYLISKEDKTKFCNGGDMDSAGYRKTITTEIVSSVSKLGLTENELAKETAILATDGMCQEALKQTNFKFTDGIVEIAPISGWAGMSISMCTCKPLVEVNLLRISNIKEVVWSSN